MNAIRHIGLLVIALFPLSILTGCSTVGETGRKQLVLLSPGEEMQLGLQSFEQMKTETPISKDAAANALVQKVGGRIAAVADLPNAQWEFVVFESKDANAFCLPGGKVGVYTGILPITKDEAGLATVIGHEVAHAYARHGGERVSQAMVSQGVSQVVGTAAAGSKYQSAIMTAYGVGSKVGFELPYSRAHESEADRIGLRFMAKAGYDPEAAVAFWQRFAAFNQQAGGGQAGFLDQFLRTHPLDETRIRNLQQWMPEAKALYKPAK
jgi:predicted Zn-dependent protease